MPFEGKDILLSIKPCWIPLIMAGQKTVELRRSFTKKHVNRVFLYQTTPVRKVVCCFRPEKVLTLPPVELWKEADGKCGLNEDEFMAYFQGKDEGFGIVISHVQKLAEIGLDALHIRPPQNFMFLNREQVSYLLGGENESATGLHGKVQGEV